MQTMELEYSIEHVCALDGCERIFSKRVHNQRFCSREHTRVYTNARILEQYHHNKNRDMKNRVCTSRGCGTVLSIYNSGKHCGSCERKLHISKLLKWGWHIDTANFA